MGAQAHHFVLAQLALGIDHHRRQGTTLRRGVEEIEGAHVRQLEAQHQAIAALLRQPGQRLGAAGDGVQRGIPGTELFQDRSAQRRVAADRQQAPRRPRHRALHLVQRLVDRLPADRLDQIADRAELDAASAFVHAGNDVHRDMPGGGIGLELLQYLPAIHVRQVDVEQDRHRQLPRQRKAGGRIVRQQHAIAALLHRARQHLCEDHVILDHQDCRGRTRRSGRQRRQCLERRLRRARPVGGRRCGRLGGGSGEALRQIELEDRAFAGRAAHLQIAAEQARHAPADRQAQAGAAVFARGGGVDLFERGEDLVQLFLRDADAGVEHFEQQRLRRRQIRSARRDAVRTAQAQGDAAVLGELEGVGQQVGEDLLQLGAVRAQGLRQSLGLLHPQRQAALFRHRPEAALADAEHVGDGDLLGQHLHLAGLDLGQVEDVVDQLQQMGAAVVDHPRRFGLVVVEVAFLVVGQAFRQDQHAVQRRAQLVRHVGEEIGLVLAGARQLRRLLLQRLPGLLQLSVGFVEDAAGFLQLLVGGAQLLSLGGQRRLRLLQLGALLLQQLVLVLQRVIGGAQLFFRSLQLLGLGLRLRQQHAGPFGIDDGVQLQAGAAQQLRQQLLLIGSGHFESGQLDHAENAAPLQRVDHQAAGRGFAQCRTDAQVVFRHRCQHDRLAVAGALPHQALPQPEVLRQIGVPGIAEAGAQEQALLRIVPGEEGAVSGAQQVAQTGQQDFAELVDRGGRLQAGVDVEQMLPHPILAVGLLLDAAEAL